MRVWSAASSRRRKQANGHKPWRSLVVALTVALAVAGSESALASANRVPFSVPFERAGMERIARERGVTVFKDPEARVIRLGAEGRIPGSPEQVFRALLDYERQVGKLERLAESRVLDRNQ